MKSFDITLSIEELENSKWKDYDFETNLVKRCYQLRKVALINLTIDDLRCLIGQQMYLNYLVELAIEKLKVNILAEGEYYPGDLLESVLNVKQVYWNEHKEQWQIINDLVKQNEEKLQWFKLNKKEFYKCSF